MNYHLRTLGNRLVVSSVSYESPLHELPQLSKDIESINFHGEVVFDLLCVNGISRNRFVSMFFDSSFDRRSKKPLTSDEIVTAQSEFYKKHPDFLYSSVLHEEQISNILCS
ncbi:type II toxin-antitoxin system RnlB family antitoxin [Vibrio vulnificus]|nr:type II toxin-antitoxin system RnlB family antitoxin [Vibrio vulnificus]ELR8760961.1 type II toxin-antitoxin system RnlB family antitoxin [Vibrio vulnificus]